MARDRHGSGGFEPGAAAWGIVLAALLRVIGELAAQGFHLALFLLGRDRWRRELGALVAREPLPLSVGGANTETIHVQLEGDIDAHCEQARRAGATIAQEPEDQFYGERTYRAVDPEGHVWTFSMHVRDVTREEAEQVTGLKIQGWV